MNDRERAAQVAWAAGLFEGEGTIAPKWNRGHMIHRYQAAIIMTDEDVLRRFADIVGIGRFYGPYQPKNPKAKPVWRWMTTRNEEIEVLYDILGAWFGDRRRTAFLAAIADSQANPPERRYHKLSATQHADVRRRYAAGGVTQAALAAEYGIHQSMVSVIVRAASPADQPSTIQTPTLTLTTK